MQFLRYRAKHTEIGNLRSFFALWPPKKNPKTKFWKMEKFARDIIILHMCTKNHNIWCTVPEIQSETEFFVIMGHILPFYQPPTSLMILKIKVLKEKKKWKKCPQILSFYTYMCTISEYHMIYGSRNIRCNRQKFLSFWAIFFLSAPWKPGKSKF